jgi:hypothetical protein
MSQWNGLTCTCITLFCCCTGPVCLSFKHRTASFLHTCSKIIKSCNYCIGVHFLDSETCYDMSCKFLNLTNFLRYSKTNNQVLSLQTIRSSSLLKPNGVSGWHAGIEVFSKLKDGIRWAKNSSTSLWSYFPVMCMKLHQGRLSFQVIDVLYRCLHTGCCLCWFIL